jgi:hypothetical protein
LESPSLESDCLQAERDEGGEGQLSYMACLTTDRRATVEVEKEETHAHFYKQTSENIPSTRFGE